MSRGIMASRELLASIMSEAQLQETLRDALLYNGWAYYHAYNSQRSPEGFPDIVAIKGQRLLVAELKDARRKPTTAQVDWLTAFAHISRVDAKLWRPAHLEEALELIQGRQ
jgi:Holliday junction resolvase